MEPVDGRMHREELAALIWPLARVFAIEIRDASRRLGNTAIRDARVIKMVVLVKR
jgi:hypothetical protein